MDTIKQMKKLIRRFKYITYIIIAIIGIVMIILARSYFSSDHGNMVYDVLMGIGCSIFATGSVTFFLLLILPDESEEKEELKAWGIVKIHPERSTASFQAGKFPKHNLDYVAFGLKHFRNANGYSTQLLKNIRKGLHVRILTLHPNSIYVTKQEQFENIDGLRDDIEALGKWVENIKSTVGAKAKGSIEIKYYDGLPLHFYCRADSTIWVGPYLPGVTSNNAITYEFQEGSRGGQIFEDAFQDYWDGEKDIHIVEKTCSLVRGDQRKGIESVLKYFADEMNQEDGDDVIGVVVLFKESKSLRRTLFSCNKTEPEKYHCHRMNDGAVGKLISLNKNSTSAMFFRDFINGISVASCRYGRDQIVKKINCETGKMQNNEDMRAILAAPIYKDSTMIGAVTFDFHNISSKYTEDVSNLQKLKFDDPINSGNILHKWFDMAQTCAQIIANLLGNEIDICYTDLYEEEWGIDE